MLALLVLALCCALAAAEKAAITMPTGTIVSAQFYCTVAPCAAHEELRITATYPVAQGNTPNDVNLQTLVPAGPFDFEVFTTYCPKSRTFFTLAADFPTKGKMTVWSSTLNGDVTVATPVVKGLEMTYPQSTSPAPLNVNKLRVNRLLMGPDGLLLTFTNGEVHQLDITGAGSFKLLFGIIPAADQLSVQHPYVTWGQVYDNESNNLYSFVFSASNVFLVTVDMSTGATTSVGPLDMPGSQNESTGFSPETVINAHMIKLQDGTNNLMFGMESLYSVGFDEWNFVNTTSGKLLGPITSMQDDYLYLECQPMNCDKLRNSAYDPVGNVLYFQGHYETQNDFYITLASVGFVVNAAGKQSYYLQPNTLANINFGYTGMQFVQFSS